MLSSASGDTFHTLISPEMDGSIGVYPLSIAWHANRLLMLCNTGLFAWEPGGETRLLSDLSETQSLLDDWTGLPDDAEAYTEGSPPFTNLAADDQRVI